MPIRCQLDPPWRLALIPRRRKQGDGIEYGLMTALIGLTIIGTVGAAGQAIRDTLYGQIVNALASMTK